MFDKQAQVSPIGIVFMYGICLVVWIMFCAEQINYWGEYAVVTHGLTGIEAWAYSNLNLIFFLISLIVMFAVMRFAD